MSGNLSRRSLLKTVGVGSTGLFTAIPWNPLRAETSINPLTPADLCRMPPLIDGMTGTDRAVKMTGHTARKCFSPPPAVRLGEIRFSPSGEFANSHLCPSQLALEFICDASRPNLLFRGVKSIAYDLHEIAWQSSADSPIYRIRSPRNDVSFEGTYPGVPNHQIVFSDDTYAYIGNNQPTGIIRDIQGSLIVDINTTDHKYVCGFYKLLITALDLH